jgi:uncharacterized protein involved in exopolysaccharide biosynthesis
MVRVFKHKWALVIPFILTTALGTTYTMTAQPWYQATATVQIQPNELEQLTPMVQARQKNLLNDQVQVLRSDSMLERIVESLSLDTRIATLLEEDVPVTDRVTWAIRVLRENILFIQPIIDTNFITITATAPTAEDSYRIPNTLAEEYVTTVRDRIAGKANSLSTRYDEEARKSQEEMEKIEAKVAKFLADNGIPDMAQRFESLRSQADQLEQELRDAKRDKVRIERNIEALEAELKKEPANIDSTTQIAANPQYQLVYQYLNELQLQRASLIATWREDSPKIKALDQQIAEAEESIKEIEPEKVAGKLTVQNPRHEQILDELVRMRPQLEATREDIETLNQSVIEVNESLTGFATLRQEYVTMQTEKIRNANMFETARARAEQARSTSAFATEIAEVNIHDPARKPIAPSGPNHILNILLSIGFGLGIGIGIAVLREVLNHSIESTDDALRHLGIPVLGVIPDKAFRRL